MSKIVLYPANGFDFDAADVAAYLAGLTSGVFSSAEDFPVTAAGGLTVTVGAGRGWVHPSRFTGYSITKRESDTLTMPLADPSLPRIDRIIMRYDAGARAASLQVLQGTASSTPTAPAISRTELIYDLCLAEIKRPAGSTAVTAADIYDTRADETVCGVMRDGVHGIPAATLIQMLRQKIAEVDNGNFYDKTETDALLNALRNQVDRKISSAISSATSITASGDGYIRFADGTQICWLKFGEWPRKKYDPYFQFPVPFANTNYGAGYALGRSVSYSLNVECNVFDRTTTGLCVSSDYEGSIVVIGRWK